MRITNATPFLGDATVCQNRDGRDQLVIILKATYRVNSGGQVSPDEVQQPLVRTDLFFGDPLTSSLQFENELGPPKPGTDVVLVGHAHPPGGQETTQLDVGIQVGPVSKVVRIFGDRFWDFGFLGSRITPAQPFTSMPLIFERAFGGGDRETKNSPHFEPRNPVGRGYVWPGMADKRPALPNLEDPKALIGSVRDRPGPAGFGFIGRHWKPRVNHAGTFDDAWRTQRFPLLPKDFDERHYQAAHPDLITNQYLRGDEPVEAHHVTSEQPIWAFYLPGFRPQAEVTVSNQSNHVPLQLDTLILLPESQQFLMLWRGQVDVHNQLLKVSSIRFKGGRL